VLVGVGGLRANQALSLVGEADETVVLGRHPRIRAALDRWLMRSAEETLGSLRDLPAVKAELRAGFWRELRGGALAAGAGGVDRPSRSAGVTGRIV
jgi:hypothetical protein